MIAGYSVWCLAEALGLGVLTLALLLGGIGGIVFGLVKLWELVDNLTASQQEAFRKKDFGRVGKVVGKVVSCGGRGLLGAVIVAIFGFLFIQIGMGILTSIGTVCRL